MEKGPGGAAFRLPPSGFGPALAALADPGGSGLRAWVIEPGMGFGETAAWWRPGTRRATPHEGLDLRSYHDEAGGRRSLGAGIPVPAVWDGVVVAVVEDFLGASIFVRHEAADAQGWRLHSILGHLLPRGGLGAGARVAAGEVLGALAEPGDRASSLPAHLHLSLALLAPGVPRSALGWELLRDRSRARLLDPAALAGRLTR